MTLIKELGDVIAHETRTNLCAHHRITVAQAVVKFLSEQGPTPHMMFAAGEALGEAANAGKVKRLSDAFAEQYRAALARLAKNQDDCAIRTIPE